LHINIKYGKEKAAGMMSRPLLNAKDLRCHLFNNS